MSPADIFKKTGRHCHDHANGRYFRVRATQGPDSSRSNLDRGLHFILSRPAGDGFDLQVLSITLPALKAEWGLTNTQAGLMATWSLAGMGIGGMAGGWLADRFGRVRPFEERLSGWPRGGGPQTVRCPQRF
ncbi:MAG TPA: MFS transporter [Variovorax sp.]